MAKSCIDGDFRSEPFSQKITYSLLASIFPISSTRPADKKTIRADGAFLVHDAKDASSELTLLYLMHFSNWMVCALVYLVLMQVSPNFVEAMVKIEESSCLDSTWVIFLGCPIAFILSILSRILYNKVQPWSVVSDASERGCFLCCPPKLKSSYTKIQVEEIMEIPEETPTLQLKRIFSALRKKHNNQ